MEKLTQLEKFIIKNNEIEIIEGLENFTNLKEFSMDYNPLNVENQLIFRTYLKNWDYKHGVKEIVEYCRKIKFEKLVKKVKLLESQLDKRGLKLLDYQRIQIEIEGLYKEIKNLKPLNE
ncbi:MAG: hypothetical protein ACFFDN_40410 [Candidatus Hodarchaeota archaeon]